MKIAVVLLVLLIAIPSFAQVESGTIIVVAESQKKVVIAADSRAIDEDWKPHDGVNKITILRPDLIFAATGVVADNSSALSPESRFVALDVAREAVRDFKSDDVASQAGLGQTAQIALAWAWKMQVRMVKITRIATRP